MKKAGMMVALFAMLALGSVPSFATTLTFFGGADGGFADVTWVGGLPQIHGKAAAGTLLDQFSTPHAVTGSFGGKGWVEFTCVSVIGLCSNTAASTIKLHGKVLDLGITSETVLASGTIDGTNIGTTFHDIPYCGFNNPSFNPSNPSTCQPRLFAAGSDQKSDVLLDALGIPPTNWAFFGLSFEFNGHSTHPPTPGTPGGPCDNHTFANGTCHYTIASAQFINNSIPEPSSLLLMGSGLLGFVAFAKRKLSSKS